MCQKLSAEESKQYKNLPKHEKQLLVEYRKKSLKMWKKLFAIYDWF